MEFAFSEEGAGIHIFDLIDPTPPSDAENIAATTYQRSDSRVSTAPAPHAVQSPTISNSDRLDISFARTGNRRFDKGERERKRVADIRRSVDTLRKRIDPEFLKGSSTKKPTRVQTLKDAICYICSLSQAVYGKKWKCGCVHVTGLAHREISSARLSSPTPGGANLMPHNVMSQSLMSQSIPPHHDAKSHTQSVNPGFMIGSRHIGDHRSAADVGSGPIFGQKKYHIHNYC